MRNDCKSVNSLNGFNLIRFVSFVSAILPPVATTPEWFQEINGSIRVMNFSSLWPALPNFAANNSGLSAFSDFPRFDRTAQNGPDESVQFL
jgi:hypothetical protein